MKKNDLIQKITFGLIGGLAVIGLFSLKDSFPSKNPSIAPQTDFEQLETTTNPTVTPNDQDVTEHEVTLEQKRLCAKDAEAYINNKQENANNEDFFETKISLISAAYNPEVQSCLANYTYILELSGSEMQTFNVNYIIEDIYTGKKYYTWNTEHQTKKDAEGNFPVPKLIKAEGSESEYRQVVKKYFE